MERRDLSTPADLWDWVDEIVAEGDDLWCVADDMDSFSQLAEAYTRLPQRAFAPVFLIPAPSCFLCQFDKGKAKLRLMSNGNWWRSSLAELGRDLGLPRLKVDLATAADPELLARCRRDTELLVEAWKVLLSFAEENRFGDIGVTIGTTALNAYRHVGMPCQIGIHDNKEAVALERAAYRGGRIETRFVGEPRSQQFWLLDVVSLYPAMMAWYPHPAKLLGVTCNVSRDYLSHILRNHLVIAEVVLSTDTPRYPAKVDGRSVYPTGDWFTTLATPELQIAMDAGEIRAIGRVAVYQPADLFSAHINLLFDAKRRYRAEGKHARAALCKDLMNLVVGKFGQRGHTQEVVGSAPLDEVSVRYCWDRDTQQPYTDLTFGGVVIREATAGEGRDAFVAIPAHVNAYARQYMWSLIEQAGQRNVYYVDTDSLLVNREGMDRLAGMIDPDRLGYLKVEACSDHVEIRAKKDFSVGDRHVRKGIRVAAVPAGQNVYVQWHFQSVKGAMARGCLEGVTAVQARRKLRYNRIAGTVQRDGWVSPLHLSVAPGEIIAELPRDCRQMRWRWWFDEDWLKRVAARDTWRGLLVAWADPLRDVGALWQRATRFPSRGGAEYG